MADTTRRLIGPHRTPKRVRPKFPEGWGVPNIPSRWITWGHASGKLRDEEVYWVSTTRSDKRPHSVPVWGLWMDDTFFFETDIHTVKATNLARNPSIVVHTQDGYDTVIVEGTASRETRPILKENLKKGYAAKYDYTPDWSRPGVLVYRVKPRVVHAWKSPHMHQSIVRFVF